MSKKKKKRSFTKEQKSDAVEYFRNSGKSNAAAARDLGIAGNTLSDWVKQADIDDGSGPESALTSSEKAEMNQMRRELKRLKLENVFLKKAAAYFAKETDDSK